MILALSMTDGLLPEQGASVSGSRPAMFRIEVKAPVPVSVLALGLALMLVLTLMLVLALTLGLVLVLVLILTVLSVLAPLLLVLGLPSSRTSPRGGPSISLSA